MAIQKATLPKMSQLETPYVTDREISTGALAKKVKKDGKKVNAGAAFSSEACDDWFVCSRGYDGDGDDNYDHVYDGNLVVRPRFENQNPKRKLFQIAVHCVHGAEKKFEIKDDVLFFDGNPVYWGAEKIDVAEEIGTINLKLPSDETGLDWDSPNKSFKLQKNQCVEVRLANGTIDFAEKIVGVKKANDYSTYSDGTQVKHGATAYHRLRPMPAKEIDGGIQTLAGMATKFDIRDHYESKKHKFGDQLDINDASVGKAVEAMTTAFVKSAEVMATLTKSNTVSGLFDQLLKGQIDEEGLRAGLKAITQQARQKEGATAEDAQALAYEIKQAASTYAEKKAQQEQAKQREQVQGAFANVDSEIDNMKF